MLSCFRSLTKAFKTSALKMITPQPNSTKYGP
jgi:hypothetical protein